MRELARYACVMVAAGVLASCAAGPRAPSSSVASPSPSSAAAAPDARLAELLAGPRRSNGCSDAAAGFDSGTRGVRAPERSMLATIRELCMGDAWPAAAIDCFARMAEGDLGRCARELPVRSRDRMFESLSRGEHVESDVRTNELLLAIAAAKLEGQRLGIAECQAFVVAVTRALVCRAMPQATRRALEQETADFWSLPSERLSAAARQKMAQVCSKSQATLEEEILAAGCMP